VEEKNEKEIDELPCAWGGGKAHALWIEPRREKRRLSAGRRVEKGELGRKYLRAIL